MANLIFLPIADQIKPSTYLLYDDASGRRRGQVGSRPSRLLIDGYI